jgi:hypothetical protein
MSISEHSRGSRRDGAGATSLGRLVPRWVRATVLLLLCAPGAWPQLAPIAERTVELALAGSENQARVMARAMDAGFLIDQLLIPQTQYIGRVGWSQIEPNLQKALEGAEPGEPYVLTGATDNYLVARVVAAGPPALLGETEYAQDPERVWAVFSVGPTDLRMLSLEVDVETDDLTAICQSKRRLLDNQLRGARAKLAALPPGAPLPQVIQAQSHLTSMLSLKGEMAQAIRGIEGLRERLPPAAAGESGSHQDVTDRFLGILELRRGEVDNCVQHHNREMCLFPLSEAARHRVGDGARRALNHFSRYLDRNPSDLEVRWLLNVAAMTVGSYPAGVPEQFRIGPDAFASPVDPGRFWDVAGPAGVAHSDNAGGSVVDDFDGDGLLDIVVSSRDPCEPLRFYRNRGDGTFADATETAGLSDQLGGLNVTQVDYDNDGRLDLFVMRGGWETAIRDSLLRNRRTPDGGTVFEDVTARVGLGGPAHRTHTASWADYDGDGWLDLFVGHELSFSQLFRSRGDGTFEDATLEAGVRFRSLTKGATWGDVNNDGRPDLYVSNFGDRNLLFVNRGDGRFDEVARDLEVSEPTYSFATWFWDYDNDGWQDLLVATLLQSVDEVAREYLDLPPLGETLRIYRNRGDGSFEDTTAALGMARMIPTMGANFGDLDNDGYLDMYLGTGGPSYGMLVPNRMFLNQEGRGFVDVTTSTGTGHLQKGHGVSFADLDNDGDEDIFSNMGGAFPGDKYSSALFENPGHGNDWISVELVGQTSNRSAIGARIRVVLEKDGLETQRVRWVTSGGSFGASPLMQHIGLGREARILRLEIDWPAGPDPAAPVQVLSDLPTNSYIVVTEGVPGFQLAPRPPFALGSGVAAAETTRHVH